jgi:hypothetical protein
MSSIETMSDEQFERHALEVLGRELGAAFGTFSAFAPFRTR